MRATRPVSWLTPARKAFEEFPEGAREIIFDLIRDRIRRLKEMLR